MGIIRAAISSAATSFADQWLEYFAPPANMTDHVAFARAVVVKRDGSQNNDGEESANIISNGSKFMVPAGTCLVITENGVITHVAGLDAADVDGAGYIFTTENVPEAKSCFGGDGFFESIWGNLKNEVKFGGQAGNQIHAFYINMRPMRGFKYGTQNPIRYKDGYYGGAMLAVTSNGTYDLRISNPKVFVEKVVPADIISGQGRSMLNLDEGDVSESIFSAVVGSLGSALSAFTKGGKSIDDIQGGTVEFAKNLNDAVEENFKWSENMGLTIEAVSPRGLDWDETSVQQINRFTTGALMQGQVGNAYAQVQVAEGINAAAQGVNAAGQNPNGGMMGVGMGMMNMGGVMNLGMGMQQQAGFQNPIVEQQQAQMQQMQQMQAAQAAQAAAQEAAAAAAAAAEQAAQAAQALNASPVAPEMPIAPEANNPVDTLGAIDGSVSDDISPIDPIAG